MNGEALTLAGGQDPLNLDGVHGPVTRSSLTAGMTSSHSTASPAPSNPRDPLTYDGWHDQLTYNGGPVVAGVDWDKPKSCQVSLAGRDIFALSPAEFIEWYRTGADGVDVVCFERPHLRARGEFRARKSGRRPTWKS